MVRGVITAGVLLAVCSVAQAADRAAGSAPIAASWQGLYVGLHGGLAGDEFSYPGSFSGSPLVSGSASLNSSGLFGGVQAGFNFQTAPNWLFGLEADISAADIEGMLSANGSSSISGFTGSASGSVGSKVDWFGTLRARAGWLYGPLLFYGTGGLAYGQTTSSYSGTYTGLSTPYSGSKSNTGVGWTAGVGIEYAVTPNVSLKTEYKYVDLGSYNLLNTSGGGGTINIDADTHFHTLEVGLNYRFGPSGAFDAPEPARTDWRGFYVGLNGGLAGDEFSYPASYVDSGTTLLNGSVSQNSSGFFGGVTAGYNLLTSSNWLLGVEGDIQAANIEGKLSANAASGGSGGSASAGSKVDWFGTLRVRAGWLYGPVLLYGTGGLAYGQTTSSVDASILGYGTGLSTSNSGFGWTVGAGFEYALSPNVSLKTEYKYVDLGSANILNVTWPNHSVSLSEETRFHTVEVGLNYRF